MASVRPVNTYLSTGLSVLTRRKAFEYSPIRPCHPCHQTDAASQEKLCAASGQ